MNSQFITTVINMRLGDSLHIINYQWLAVDAVLLLCELNSEIGVYNITC